ncbi:alpha/beta fold hydrolase [Streptomyces otsuchiensis]|uniref:alpha/beta fold hydrolase n=1 Tax=Streptomyces otsuchiensis TaxID=2681388 RepID=UPI0010303A58|nr:alpha/beta hydrolase [Streptomyces otsuchiensis]
MSRPPFIEPPSRVTARRIGTRRGEFAALEARPAGTALGTALLVPGFTGSKEDFIALLAPLADAGYRAVAVDGRGQYETPPPTGRDGYRIGALAEDVLAQAEAVTGAADGHGARESSGDGTGGGVGDANGGGGELHLLGHSFGGLISRGAVLRDPAPFASLTLLSSGPGRVARWPRWRTRALAALMPVAGPERVWQALNPKEGTDAVSRFMRRRWLSNHRGQLRATGRQLRFEPDRVERLAATGVPVHVVSGERDDAWPLPLMDDMAERLGARRTVIKGAAHSPNAEQPGPTAAALLEFWTALDAGRPGS